MQFELPLMHLQHKSRGMYFGISKLRILYKRVLLVQPKKKKKKKLWTKMTINSYRIIHQPDK